LDESSLCGQTEQATVEGHEDSAMRVRLGNKKQLIDRERLIVKTSQKTSKRRQDKKGGNLKEAEEELRRQRQLLD
jgi:hypothetical protein